ncbi:CHC2 zinc finger [Cohaesibacter sp. ES.047]|uniref:CHC2 zinc finger domain-containing protein n=1 Tax=Cohaesibacter sp. ES.047 TaxID=1798205 RepID=UPI000BB85EAC|nr:CHC2 zinc finger domain-containing protein [Cohaesibacter sp. ES.047]SNY93398.1 CHC2 zinc finger [Cohaesibacter sp. ES.047]
MTLTIDRNAITALKKQIVLSDVIGKSVKLHQGGTWMTGLCPFHEDHNPSFSVSDVSGRYICHACGAHGDIFDWVAHTDQLDPQADFLQVFRRVQDIVGDHSVATTLPQHDTAKRGEKIKANSEERRQKAIRNWRKGRPIEGTKAETYLRDCRGIRTVDFTGMPFRFIDNHERWIWCDRLKKPVMVGRWPCLLTAIQEVEPNSGGKHRFLALHRTWFDLDEHQGKPKIIYTAPDGKVREIARKKIDGDYFGRGAIMLTQPDETLAVTEGIENGLTALELGPYRHVWVAVSLNAFGAMPLLPVTKHMIIISDSDSKTPKAALMHQEKLCDTMHRQRLKHNVDVDIKPAPPGYDLNDWHLKQLLHHALATGQ